MTLLRLVLALVTPAVVTWWRQRGSLAWHVLRGRPLAYRVELRGHGVGFVANRRHTMFVDCTVIQEHAEPMFEFERDALGVTPDEIKRWFG